MRFGFCLIVIILFITIPQIGHARVCATSYPYVQTIEGQHIVIKAIPLDPHSCSPSLGTTEIYNEKKLLYTIDSYIDAPIFPSNDGQYLAIIHRSHLAIAHVFLPEQKQVWDYDFVAIDVLKWGKPYKQFYLKDVIDTALLDHKSGNFSWCYGSNYNAIKQFTERYKRSSAPLSVSQRQHCLQHRDTCMQCKEWLSVRDSLHRLKLEENIYLHSMYVEDNALFVQTNQITTVQLNFSNLTIQRYPFAATLPVLAKFNPPKVKRVYTFKRFPDVYAEPLLNNGSTFDEAIAQLFGLTIAEKEAVYIVYIHHLVLNKKGECVDFYGHIYDKNKADFFTEEALNEEMRTRLVVWIKDQRFQSKLMPKGFKQYSFLCITELK